eukprot:4261982-Prymnesium_polylepis.2
MDPWLRAACCMLQVTTMVIGRRGREAQDSREIFLRRGMARTSVAKDRCAEAKGAPADLARGGSRVDTITKNGRRRGRVCENPWLEKHQHFNPVYWVLPTNAWYT